ncbi:MAG: hypothetical protein QOJ40_2606 [Verrucomicrobiota bacterium]
MPPTAAITMHSWLGQTPAKCNKCSERQAYRPWGSVCELREFFAWRVPRSSRVSRDCEKMFFLFFGFGCVTVSELGRSR